MSIFMKATLEVDPLQLPEVLAALTEKLFPLMEEQGWHLHGCFVDQYGSVRPAIITDIWEMEGMAHVERVLQDYSYREDPRYQECRGLLLTAIKKETLVFMKKCAGSLVPVYA